MLNMYFMNLLQCSKNGLLNFSAVIYKILNKSVILVKALNKYKENNLNNIQTRKNKIRTACIALFSKDTLLKLFKKTFD